MHHHSSLNFKNLMYCCLFFCYTFLQAQESTEKKVYLVEEKLKKRTLLYVQNDTDSEKSVFLKIDPIGYRRRAQRPILKNIPAHTKVQMCILIPLTDVPSSYTYQLIVNDNTEPIEVNRSHASQ